MVTAPIIVTVLEQQATNPLTGRKVAGYVGCQTVCPFAATESGGQYDLRSAGVPRQFRQGRGAEPVAFAWRRTRTPGSTTTRSRRSSWWNRRKRKTPKNGCAGRNLEL